MNIKIGIDFSLNSPAIVVKKEDSYKWLICNHSPKKIKPESVEYKRLKEFTNFDNTQLHIFERLVDKDYAANETLKMHNAHEIAKLINFYCISQGGGDITIDIGIEGYSYGSSGNSLIDIITYSSILRDRLCKSIHEGYIKSFTVLTPSQIKKHAGKGNFSKVEMFDSFINVEDKILKNDKFFHYITSNVDKIRVLKKNDTIEIKSPFNDLVDAYYITQII
jgi:hypothetical protein